MLTYLCSIYVRSVAARDLIPPFEPLAAMMIMSVTRRVLVAAMFAWSVMSLYGPFKDGGRVVRQKATTPSQISTWKVEPAKVAVGFLASMFFCNAVVVPRANADQQWSDYNRIAADTWRTVDELFLDRTFNNQDWFQLRQQIVKRTYKSDEEVYDAIKVMMSKLGKCI